MAPSGIVRSAFFPPASTSRQPAFRVYSLLFVLLISLPLFCQNQQPQSDPRAVALATQSISAMTGSVSISDVTLTGSGTWTVGSGPQNVTVTLMAKGNYESRMDLQFPDGQQSEIRNNTGGWAQSEWLNVNGNATQYALQNCWTDPGWFFPLLSSLNLSDPTVILTYVGVEGSTYHLQSYKNPSALGQKITGFVNSVSVIDFYLDTNTLLPVEVAFSGHPDDDASTNIPVVITLSNYTPVNGLRVPFRIRKTWNGNLLSDFTISSASFNSGLPDTLFSIQ